MPGRMIAILFGFAISAASLFTAWWCHNASGQLLALPTAPYCTPSIPPEFQGEIRYLSRTSPGEYDTDDGPSVYLEHHRRGWDDCLLYFYNDWIDFGQAHTWAEMDDARDDIPWLVGAPPHIVTARRHGWLSCTTNITNLTSQTSADSLRKTLPVHHSVLPLVAAGMLAFAAALILALCPHFRASSTGDLC